MVKDQETFHLMQGSCFAKVQRKTKKVAKYMCKALRELQMDISQNTWS